MARPGYTIVTLGTSGARAPVGPAGDTVVTLGYQ